MKPAKASLTPTREAVAWAWTASLLCTFLLAGCGSKTPATGADATQQAEIASTSGDVATSETSTDAQEAAQDSVSTTVGCSQGKTKALGTNFFVDISAQSGIRAGNVVRNSQIPVPINDHSRLGFVDLDGDRRPDIVTHSLYPNPKKGIPFEHLIYRNLGGGKFEDFSDASGLRAVQAGFFAFADIDNDGDQDCFAGLDTPLKGEHHRVFLNDGKGHFTEKKQAGVESLPSIAGNAVFADFDGDAKLDLFIGMGHTSYSAANVLLKGNGDGTFSTGIQLTGGNPAQPTNGSVLCDFNDDGKPDLAVSNYGVSVRSGHNALYVNQGDGTLKNVAEEVGFAYLMGGNPWLKANGQLTGVEPKAGPTGPIGSNGFGLDCGDIDRDGRMDLFVTAISHPNMGTYTRKWSDSTQVLLNRKNGDSFMLVDEAKFRGLPFNEGDIDGALVDFDNDGRLDLSISRDKKYEGNYAGVQQKAWFGLMHQQASGKFTSVGPVSGLNQLDAKPSASLSICDTDAACFNGEKCLAKRCRTACTVAADCSLGHETCHTGGFCKSLLAMKMAQNHAWADVDGDGDLDLLVGGRDTGGGRPNFLFRNDIGQDQPVIRLWLEGDGKNVNRDAIGARVTVRYSNTARYPNEVQLSREIKASRGMHCSMDDRAVLIGLGDLGCGYSVRVRWPDGKIVDFSADQLPAGVPTVLRYPASLSQP